MNPIWTAHNFTGFFEATTMYFTNSIPYHDDRDVLCFWDIDRIKFTMSLYTCRHRRLS